MIDLQANSPNIKSGLCATGCSKESTAKHMVIMSTITSVVLGIVLVVKAVDFIQ